MKKAYLFAFLISFACSSTMFALYGSNISKANKADSDAAYAFAMGNTIQGYAERNNAQQYRNNATINLTTGITTCTLAFSSLVFGLIKAKKEK